MFGNKHQWSLVLKSFKHLLSLQISFLFIVNSQSLHYMPNQTLFYQRQVIWIIKQCFLMWNKLHYSYKQNKCFEDWFSKTLKLKFEPFLINKTPLHISTKTQKKKSFNSYENISMEISWILFRTSLLEIDIKMVFMSGMALKFPNFLIKWSL
jgi:hypothetical protein